MIFAIGNNGKRIRADKTVNAICPCCKTDVIARIGKINIPHWAHKSVDCDHWHEPETDWHLNWKAKFPDSNVEQTIGPHRADVVTDLGVVIEFQNSPISPEEIFERESFYQNMIWVFNLSEASDRFLSVNRGTHHTFRFFHPRKHISYCEKPIYLDFGNRMFEVRKSYQGFRRGWGYKLSVDQFLRKEKIFRGFESVVGSQKELAL